MEKLKISVGVLFLLLLAACKPTERQLNRKLDYVERHDKTLFAPRCERLYPIRESHTKEIEYLPGKTDTIPGETKYVNCADSTNKDKNVAVPCPPSYNRVDTAKITSKILQESSAKLEKERKEWQTKEAANIRLITKLEMKLLQAEEELAFYHKIRRWVLWLGGACLAIWLLFQFKGGWIKIVINFFKKIF